MRSLKATASGRKSSGGRDVVFGVAADVDVGRADKVKAFGIGGGLAKQPERLCMAGSTSLRILR